MQACRFMNLYMALNSYSIEVGMKIIHYIEVTVLRFTKKMKRDKVSSYAAETAFFTIMSFVPFAILLVTLIQHTLLTPEILMNFLVGVLPAQFYDLISGIVRDIYSRSVALMSGTVIAAVWSTSRAMLALTNGLNSVRDVKENRNYFYMRLRAGICIVFLTVAVIIAMVLLLFGDTIQNMLIKYIPALGKLTAVIISFRAILSLSILSVIFLAMYCVLPNCKMNPIRQIPGAMFSATGWAVLSYGFSIYFHYFSGNSIYGSLTTVVMMMLWLYFCMELLYVGAEVNCFLEYPDAFRAGEME